VKFIRCAFLLSKNKYHAMRLILLYFFLLFFSSFTFSKDLAVNQENSWHHWEGKYRNPQNSVSRQVSTFDRLQFFSSLFLTRNRKFETDKSDEHVLRSEEALSQLAAAKDSNSITWIGHSTFLVRLNGLNILTDPILSDRASLLSFAGPERKVSLNIRVKDLPLIDVVIVSQAHYDHLDTKTLDALPGKDSMTVVVPLGLGRLFRDRGFVDVREVDWYDDVTVDTLKVTAYPAIHWSNRTPFDVNETLWMSYGLSSGGVSVFHSGDTDMHETVFSEIGVHMSMHHQGCDIGLMSVGAYSPEAFMKGAHMTPESGVKVGRQVGCSQLIPMHWGTFKLSLEPFFEPRDRFQESAGSQAYIMKIGETLQIVE
jgi:N-acyl-phosphatidylethanolamine-hydrolysing phospholipase D